MSEQAFENRMVKLFRKLGFLVINCAASRPFDIVAFYGERYFIIELKAKNTRYPKEQQKEQLDLCLKTNTWFYIIRQSKKIRGRLLISMLSEFDENGKAFVGLNFLRTILWKWREDR